MTQAEKEELAVNKRRAEGTPCTAEYFNAWKEKFDAEMASQQQQQQRNQSTGGLDVNTTTSSSRQTGYDYFNSRAALNWDALEEEAAAAAADEEEDDDDDVENEPESAAPSRPNHVNEDLFDDDVDLDDLDFEDDDDDDDDDDDVDI